MSHVPGFSAARRRCAECERVKRPGSRAETLTLLAVGLLLTACGSGQEAPAGPSDGESVDVRVEVSTRGTNLDPDGYSVSLDGRVTRPVEIDGHVTFQNVPAGPHDLTLSGLASTCYPVTTLSRQILVSGAEPPPQRFAVTCMGIPPEVVVVFTTLRDEPDSEDFELYGIDAHGMGAVNLTNHPAVDVDPAWSPNGQRLAFSSGREDRVGDIYVVNADGTGLARLTEHPGPDRFPAWSPDGSQLAFIRSNDLWVMNADGSDPVQLTGTTQLESRPTWSPDGTRIAFERNSAQGPTIIVMNINGSGGHNLLQNPNVELEPAWSPDGLRIAFRGLESGDYDLWTVRVDGSDRARVRALPGLQAFPAWTPDGRIAFSSQHEGDGTDLFVIPLGGGSADRLTTDGAANLYPTWRPRPP